MTGGLQAIWVYLASSPLLALTMTIFAYLGGDWLYRRCNHNPLMNPVLVSVAVVVGVLLLTRTSYEAYFQGAQFIHFLLGPATVALAVPLYRRLKQVRKSVVAILLAVCCGAITAAGSTVGIAWMLGASEQTLMSLAPKSVTAPVAMGIAEQLGGIPTLTAVVVIVTGILGAMIATGMLNLLGIRDARAVGLAIGVASHGIGTARAFQVSDVVGAFSGMAMGLNALVTALLLPPLIGLLF